MVVSPSLLVRGLDGGVFAIGDACDTDEEKMAAHAANHAKVVVENIKRMAVGRGDLLEYKPGEDNLEGIVIGAIAISVFSRVHWHDCDDRQVPRGGGDQWLDPALVRRRAPQGEDALHTKVLGADGARDAKIN